MHFFKIASGVINDGSYIFTETKDVVQNIVPTQLIYPKVICKYVLVQADWKQKTSYGFWSNWIPFFLSIRKSKIFEQKMIVCRKVVFFCLFLTHLFLIFSLKYFPVHVLSKIILPLINFQNLNQSSRENMNNYHWTRWYLNAGWCSGYSAPSIL